MKVYDFVVHCKLIASNFFAEFAIDIWNCSDVINWGKTQHIHETWIAQWLYKHYSVIEQIMRSLKPSSFFQPRQTVILVQLCCWNFYLGTRQRSAYLHSVINERCTSIAQSMDKIVSDGRKVFLDKASSNLFLHVDVRA